MKTYQLHEILSGSQLNTINDKKLPFAFRASVLLPELGLEHLDCYNDGNNDINNNNHFLDVVEAMKQGYKFVNPPTAKEQFKKEYEHCIRSTYNCDQIHGKGMEVAIKYASLIHPDLKGWIDIHEKRRIIKE